MDEEKLQKIEQEINIIKERNKRVEADKAWEISFFRRIIITIFTYFVMVIFMYLVDLPSPWLAAFIPALAYLISTLTMLFIKKWWVGKKYKKI